MAFKKTIKKETITGLTYGEILDRYVLLDRVTNLPGEKLCFARRKNLLRLRTFEKLHSAKNRIPVTPEYEAYQQELSELRGKYLLTDAEGKTVMQQMRTESGYENSPLVDVANPDLQAKADQLKKLHISSIKEREDDIRAYTEFMDEVVPETDLPQIHMVSPHDVTGLNQEQVDAVYWFISEESIKA